MPHFTTSKLAALMFVMSGCTPFSLSPPARNLPLESSATVGDGAVAVQAAGGAHNAVDEAGGHASASVAVGVSETLEVQGEANYTHISYGDERSPHVGAGRVGLKYAAIPHLAVVAGLGVGSGAHGVFVAPDLGVIGAYENAYVVPWGAVRATISGPADPSTITVTRQNGDTFESFDLVPPSTFAWQVSTGVRVPAYDGEDYGVDILAGVGLLGMHGMDGEHSHAVLLGAGGVRLTLKP